MNNKFFAGLVAFGVIVSLVALGVAIKQNPDQRLVNEMIDQLSEVLEKVGSAIHTNVDLFVNGVGIGDRTEEWIGGSISAGNNIDVWTNSKGKAFCVEEFQLTLVGTTTNAIITASSSLAVSAGSTTQSVSVFKTARLNDNFGDIFGGLLNNTFIATTSKKVATTTFSSLEDIDGQLGNLGSDIGENVAALANSKESAQVFCVGSDQNLFLQVREASNFTGSEISGDRVSTATTSDRGHNYEWIAKIHYKN